MAKKYVDSRTLIARFEGRNLDLEVPEREEDVEDIDERVKRLRTVLYGEYCSTCKKDMLYILDTRVNHAPKRRSFVNYHCNGCGNPKPITL